MPKLWHWLRSHLLRSGVQQLRAAGWKYRASQEAKRDAAARQAAAVVFPIPSPSSEKAYVFYVRKNRASLLMRWQTRSLGMNRNGTTPEAFLQLPREERADVLQGLAPSLGQAPQVLEKDIWVCWVLEHLFAMPGRLKMAFKGGTSLSKVFREIRPYASESVAELRFPIAQVDVLLPSRTFWEKATLIHVECHRGEFRTTAEWLSRHWYDLVMLAEHEIGKPRSQIGDCSPPSFFLSLLS